MMVSRVVAIGSTTSSLVPGAAEHAASLAYPSLNIIVARIGAQPFDPINQ
jgi:hypothetical protein